jgi:hypothetical protein
VTLVPINEGRPGIVYIKTKVAQVRGCKPATKQGIETWVKGWEGKKRAAAQRTKANQPHPAQRELDNTSEPALGRQWSGPRASDVMHNGVAKLVAAGIAGARGRN